MHKPADYHTHTYLCKHAKGEAREYARAAESKELPEICFADHAPAPGGYDARHRMELEQFPIYRELVAQIRDIGAPAVLYGIEADYYKDCEKFLCEWLGRQEFDLVIGSVHYIGDWGFDSPENRNVWNSADVTQTWREYFGLVGKLAETGLYDVVGHIDIPKKFGYRPSDDDLREMVQPALDRVSAAGMGIEINTSGLRKPVGEIYPSPLILSLAFERDIPICFGSDAHSPEEVGYAFDEAVKLAREAGYRQRLRFKRREKRLVEL